MDHKEGQHEAHKDHKAHKALPEELELLGRAIVSSGLKVHKALGPGSLESTYEHCLAHELGLRDLSCQRQITLPMVYEGETIDAGYRLDIVVEDSIILEIKAIEALSRLNEAQILTYLKFTGYRLGYLMNFNVVLFMQGLRRFVR